MRPGRGIGVGGVRPRHRLGSSAPESRVESILDAPGHRRESYRDGTALLTDPDHGGPGGTAAGSQAVGRKEGRTDPSPAPASMSAGSSTSAFARRRRRRMLKRLIDPGLGPAAGPVGVRTGNGAGRQDLLLDLPRLAHRSRVDLLPGRCGPMGKGHRQHGEDLVPQRRCPISAGSCPRGHRRRRGRHRHQQPRSGQPGRSGQGSPRRRTSPSSISTRPTRAPTSMPMSGRTTSMSADAGPSTSSMAGYVKSGDTVFTPVEVAGATYGEQEKEGIMSVFDPLGIKIDAIETGLDQAQIISVMSDYLTAHKDTTAAMIGLGDLVTGSVARVGTRSASRQATSRSSAGATRPTRPRRSRTATYSPGCGKTRR